MISQTACISLHPRFQARSKGSLKSQFLFSDLFSILCSISHPQNWLSASLKQPLGPFILGNSTCTRVELEEVILSLVKGDHVNPGIHILSIGHNLHKPRICSGIQRLGKDRNYHILLHEFEIPQFLISFLFSTSE